MQRLQAVLGHLGFSIADREGYFGKTTRQAVLRFQEQHGLELTGIVDEETTELINRGDLASATISSSAAP